MSTGAGESYEENAITELKEEMGIEGIRPQHHFDFWFEMPGLRMWGALFSCLYDGEMTLQPEEVESGEWRSEAVSTFLYSAIRTWHASDDATIVHDAL